MNASDGLSLSLAMQKTILMLFCLAGPSAMAVTYCVVTNG